jgi:transmembrane sensor
MELNSDLRTLLQKYASGEISPEERTVLYRALTDDHNESEFKTILHDLAGQTKGDAHYNESDWTGVIRSILEQKAERPKLRPLQKIWFRAAAAAIFIGLLFGTYFLITKKSENPAIATSQFKSPDVAPGSNKATLTLGNGSTMILDSQAVGTLAQQGNAKIVKIDSGQLSYKIESDKPSFSEDNTLSTPRGGQYQLVLPDGTKVWLNAASSITYPTAFTNKERKVTVTGEAYFEVVHNAKMPFIVKVNNQEITDLGTSFNINAYPDEANIKTTLLEGSVSVSYNNQKELLKPGQQSQATGNNLTVVDHADLKKVMAWKNGLFRFDGDDLSTVMRSISRWYDVDVVYDVKPTDHFTGVISRNVNASEVFNMLELTGAVHFKIKDKTVTVVK